MGAQEIKLSSAVRVGIKQAFGRGKSSRSDDVNDQEREYDCRQHAQYHSQLFSSVDEPTGRFISYPAAPAAFVTAISFVASEQPYQLFTNVFCARPVDVQSALRAKLDHDSYPPVRKNIAFSISNGSSSAVFKNFSGSRGESYHSGCHFSVMKTALSLLCRLSCRERRNYNIMTNMRGDKFQGKLPFAFLLLSQIIRGVWD